MQLGNGVEQSSAPQSSKSDMITVSLTVSLQ